MAAGVRVPGVRVHQVRACRALRHLQVDAEGGERPVRPGQLRGDGVGGHAGLVAGCAEAPHLHLDPGPEGLHQLRRVHARAAVDLGRILPGQEVDSHGRHPSPGVPGSPGRGPATVVPLALRCGHAIEEDFRHRARRRRGQAADAADRGPSEARRAVRRGLPARGLRPVEPAELRHHADRRAHPVQVAQPRPPRRGDLAAVRAAQLLRGLGARAAAARQALVRRQRRRDLPEPQPHRRRAARHRRGGRRRPRLPDGLRADDRRPHLLRSAGDGRRDPPADRARRARSA